MTTGILYIVATPIGTLNDFSPRAKEILSTVSFIACEDTRHSGKLLSYFGIKSQFESLHTHNEKNKCSYLIDKILNSATKSAAIITDAGTPCISDPGSLLVAEAHEKGVLVQSIPGPSSMTAALAACGFIQPRYLFSAFLGRTQKEQFSEFEKWQAVTPCLAVFFESPKRLLASLKNLDIFFHEQEIKICVSREISKKFEEHKIGLIKEIIHYFSEQNEIQGEFVITLNLPKNEMMAKSIEEAAIEAERLSEKGLPLKIACKEIAEKYNLNSKELYNKINKDR
ncbi:16S rRNA (cytidine(1402)-2'-O)-methyltransferase [Silvanigrella aquatica]|uniref:Ribosomal RNA small subunit methyltransferase I n=1 Tax=Silvanigrella aquatica TaxID=1915309 RepID=A0A1L4CXB3_9BACT|nr:16S rRNA (cytidine(1402)-2'-O)-methyltransferase [Silvanigrella aquatica]APJ02591.1 16S rRNA (cytidine(1402)-2'-O)-methyltransferase [Silvanigrella aquatica]